MQQEFDSPTGYKNKNHCSFSGFLIHNIMIPYIKSYIKSFKYIKGLFQFDEKKINEIQFVDEFYKGLNGEDTELRIFYAKKSIAQSIIIFPGASPYAENHPGMIMLANALRNAGHHVFLPRIPNLKNLILVKDNVKWFSHCYKELLQHKKINQTSPMVAGLSYGGANLLRASLDKNMQNPAPLSILSYGTYYSIDTALDFFISGKISFNNKTYNIKPHEWGPIVMFYNFFKSIEADHDQETITQLLQFRIQDKHDEVDQILSTLNDKDKKIVKNILSGTIDEYLKTLIEKMLDANKDLLEYLSPNHWAEKIQSKVFILHGANDSMVPFTESTRLSETIPNNELLISFLYEHREISTDRGIFFKLKELIKMINYFSYYFRFNK